MSGTMGTGRCHQGVLLLDQNLRLQFCTPLLQLVKAQAAKVQAERVQAAKAQAIQVCASFDHALDPSGNRG